MTKTNKQYLRMMTSGRTSRELKKIDNKIETNIVRKLGTTFEGLKKKQRIGDGDAGIPALY